MTLPDNFVRQLIICVVVCLVFYGGWVVYSGAEEVWLSARRLGWLGWAIILGLSLFNYLVRFVRWDWYLSALGYKIPWRVNLGAYLAGFGFTTTPGKIGEVVRSVYLKPYGVSYTHSLAAFFAERLVDIFAMLVVASLAAYEFAGTRWLVGVTCLLCLSLLPMIHSERLKSFVETQSHNSRSDRLRGYSAGMLKLWGSSAELLRTRLLYSGLGLGLLAWFAEGYALYVVLDFMGADTPVLLAAGIYGVSILAGAVSFVPGGLGGTEVVMGSLLMLTGIDAPVAVSAVIICRVATLWFAVIIGLGFLMLMEWQRNRMTIAGLNVASGDNRDT